MADRCMKIKLDGRRQNEKGGKRFPCACDSKLVSSHQICRVNYFESLFSVWVFVCFFCFNSTLILNVSKGSDLRTIRFVTCHPSK